MENKTTVGKVFGAILKIVGMYFLGVITLFLNFLAWILNIGTKKKKMSYRDDRWADRASWF